MIKSLRHFEIVIGYNVSQMDAVITQLGKYYNTFQKVKKSGKKREFNSSESILRELHNRISDRIFSCVTLPYFITGSVKERSAVINAKFHSGKKYHFQTDLVGYFDFVSNKLVYSALRELGFSADVASYITKFTTYKGHLPQGVPTSPFLSNLVGLMIIDNDILEFCRNKGIIYTRYIDDLTFSSDSDLKEYIPYLLNLIAEKCFLYSHRKTLYKVGDVSVTGVLTTCNGLKETQELTSKLEEESNIDKKKGMENYVEQIKKVNKRISLKHLIQKFPELSFPDKIPVKHFKTA